MKLRKALLDITKRFTAHTVREQLRAVDELRNHCPHQIKVIRAVDLDDFRSWRFNCHAFTFGLWRQERFWELQESHPNIWPDGAFVTDHLLPQMCVAATHDLGETAVVLYYEGSRIKHSGLKRGELVHSKWGDCHTWEHGVLEVPISYGERVVYYQAPPIEIVIEVYLRFAAAA